MTDLIERVDAVFTEEGGEAPAAVPGTPPEGGTSRPLHILLVVAMGGSAVLLFSMASGHLKGTQATIGIVAALVRGAGGRNPDRGPSRALFREPSRPTRPWRSSGWVPKGRTPSPR